MGPPQRTTLNIIYTYAWVSLLPKREVQTEGMLDAGDT